MTNREKREVRKYGMSYAECHEALHTALRDGDVGAAEEYQSILDRMNDDADAAGD